MLLPWSGEWARSHQDSLETATLVWILIPSRLKKAKRFPVIVEKQTRQELGYRSKSRRCWSSEDEQATRNKGDFSFELWRWKGQWSWTRTQLELPRLKHLRIMSQDRNTKKTKENLPDNYLKSESQENCPSGFANWARFLDLLSHSVSGSDQYHGWPWQLWESLETHAILNYGK